LPRFWAGNGSQGIGRWELSVGRSAFTASGLEPIPSRCNEASNDLPPKLRLVLGGLSKIPGPTHKSFRSIANNRVPRRIPVQALQSEFQCELPGAVGSLRPLERGLRSLLLVWLWSSL
jgi:hypothetical protein